jgi:hypothetical protein
MGQTLRDLFKSRKGEVYGSTGNQIFIETQGVVNIPRQAALLASSPSGLNQLIGNQIGGLFKGSANRPSDTIYPSNSPTSKPVSLIPGAVTGVRDAVEGGEDKRYFINKKPSGNSLVGQLRSGKKPTAMIGAAAVNALKNPFRAAKGIADMIKGLNAKENSAQEYGAKYSEVQTPGDTDTKIITSDTDITYSEYYRVYTRDANTKEFTVRGTLEKRTDATRMPKFGKRKFSQIVYEMQKNGENWDETKNSVDVPYVKIESYDNSWSKFYFPATITGLTENFTPEVSSFRYVGSPFNLYTYKGIERSIQFSFKLYFVDHATKVQMIRTLNRLRTLVFPNPNVAGITYPTNVGSSLIAIKPNLIYLTISGVYEKVFGIVDSFGISIDDSSPWVTTIPDDSIYDSSAIMEGEGIGLREKPYPSVITCTFGMKIIESPPLDITDRSFGYKDVQSDYFTGVSISDGFTFGRNQTETSAIYK